jgi:hypothetical protein
MLLTLKEFSKLSLWDSICTLLAVAAMISFIKDTAYHAHPPSRGVLTFVFSKTNLGVFNLDTKVQQMLYTCYWTRSKK